MFDTVKSGWFIVYIEGSQFIIPNTIVFLTLKIVFVLPNSAHPDEMTLSAAFTSWSSLFTKVTV